MSETLPDQKNSRPSGLKSPQLHRDTLSEKQFRKIEECINTLMFQTPAVVFSYQMSGGRWDITYISDNIESVIGFSPKAFIADFDAWKSRVHPDDIDTLMQNMQSEKTEGMQRTIEYRVKNKKGVYQWIYDQQRVVTDEDGNVEIVSAWWDITERRQAMESLQLSEARFQKMLSLVPDMISIQDAEMNIVYANWCGFGAVSEEKRVLGTKCYRTYRGFEAICEDCWLLSVKETKKMFQEERKLPDGRWISLRVLPLLDENQNIEFFVEWIRDITERKRAEQDRHTMQAQLLQAQKIESVGLLAGGVAHEFNNLFQILQGNIEILGMDTPEDHPQRKRLKTIQTHVKRGARLVQQLLLFSCRQQPQKQIMNLNFQIKETVSFLKQTILKGVTIELQLDRHAWPVNADQQLIAQVLINLGTNAEDAMDEKGRIRIETRNVVLDERNMEQGMDLAPGKYVCMTVSDTGSGIDPATMPHIFEPFYTTKSVGKGTGLGLATVYGIVKEHKGNITCASEPGRGTRFTLYWPAISGKQEEKESLL